MPVRAAISTQSTESRARNSRPNLLTLLRASHAALLEEIRIKKELSKELEQQLKAVLEKFAKDFADTPSAVLTLDRLRPVIV